ncbi:MAG: addiction module protein [Candidatus Methylumidiphilus sp.]
MKSDPRQIIDDAMQLDSASRALIAETLLETLDFEEEFTISQEWMDEIHRRCDAMDNGTTGLVDNDTVIQQLRGKYT